MTDDYLRAFIAIELPDNIRGELARLRDALAGGMEPGIKWVSPDSIHLTLKFLGNVAMQRIPELETAVKQASSMSEPFRLKLSGLGAFPSQKRPEVIWCGLQGDTEPLSQLQHRIEEKLIPLGFPAETRLFSPHLTLARVRRDTGTRARNRLMNRIQEVKSPAGPAFDIDTVSLMQSRLTPAGAVYTTLAAVPLAGMIP